MVTIERFDPLSTAEAGFAAYHAVFAASRETDRPGEPVLPLGELAGRLTRPLPGMGDAAQWVAYRGDELVAFAEVHFLEAENNGIALTDVVVHPAVRRSGIGTALLHAVLPELRARDCRSVEGWQVVAGSAGELWAEALGFRPVRTIVRQALVVAEADQTRWEVPVPVGYRVVRWAGAAPDDLLGSYAGARAAIHDAPLGDSGYRWPEWTPARVRATEAEARSQGLEQRIVAAVHEGTGEVVGFTEVCVHPRRADWGYQRDTAVLAGHRGHGLGRCVKAHMIRWLLAERPGLRRISTTTGAENVHMLRVNRELGLSSLPAVIAVQQDLDALLSPGRRRA
ncbi:GNAT superfamily N-acetyltransferase [Amycolatopsis lexingtonensis]|uniref:GNAT superfamily N-acetyltransferase n=1 Tax=Amycolatopsis lexingtonensis TaxID=218822 RepID=A0ABR9IC94_9PSEU|nr:GNAT family N-acetyltransferase [Amycolatopsis lexingtonensis]MBE1500805.1 GNAT superfamily N-acetyltransferase [Amycolatopsis lexingtonensis]